MADGRDTLDTEQCVGLAIETQIAAVGCEDGRAEIEDATLVLAPTPFLCCSRVSATDFSLGT